MPSSGSSPDRPVTVIVLGLLFAVCGVFCGLSPSDSVPRPIEQIIMAVILALIGLLFVVQGVGRRRKERWALPYRWRAGLLSFASVAAQVQASTSSGSRVDNACRSFSEEDGS